MSNGLNVAVLGARGIGRFHVREFLNAGCNVVAILGKTLKSSMKISNMLKEEYGIQVRNYSSLDKLLYHNKIDLVSVCTPPNTHKKFVEKCLIYGADVLCEKPFLREENNYLDAGYLISMAKKKKKVLSVNTQWVSILSYIKKEIKLNEIKDISIYMEPNERGIEMLRDHLPHANSILVKIIPKGKVENIEFDSLSDEEIIVRLKYLNSKSNCKVKYIFRKRLGQRGKIMFKFNGKCFKRELGDNYQQFLVSGKNRFNIEDPLKVSIKRFIDSCLGRGIPLIGKRDILENILLAEKIINAYKSLTKTL